MAKSCQMLPPDREAFLDILKRYNLTDQLAVDYPNWWIMERRVTIDRLCAQMLQSIRSANAIYPTSEQEYWERRLQQNKAIGAVEALSEELQFVIAMMYQTLGVDVEKYMPFAELLEKELNLLKGWRKSDNRILRQIKNGKTKKGEGDDAPSANPKNF